jgi:hypothetical protein
VIFTCSVCILEKMLKKAANRGVLKKKDIAKVVNRVWWL